MSAPLWPVVDADALLTGVIELLAGRPDLAQKLLDLRRRDESAGKTSTLYSYLFEIAPRSANGAENYIAAIRRRSTEQLDLAVGTLNRDEVVEGGHLIHPEITPEMIEAGRNVIASRWLDFIGPRGSQLWDEVLGGVFRAMSEAQHQ